jgi:preprotein translocase subunit SecE
MIQFAREAAAEVSRINWPSRREVIGLTVLVLLVSVVVAAYLGALDVAFTWLVERSVTGA